MYMTNRIKTFLPVAVLLLIVLGGAIWYMMSVPAPTPSSWNTTDNAEPATQTITDEGTYYSIKAQYPTFTSLKGIAGAQADAAATATMKGFVEQEIAKFKDNGNFANLSHDDVQMLGLDQRKYELGIEYTIHENSSTLSFVYQLFADTGGAHPNTYYRTFTFDKKTGEALSMHDLFTEGSPYLETLSKASRAKLLPLIAERTQSQISEVDTDYIASGTMAEEDAFQNFYLEGDALVLVFPPYQVGPYVLGMIELPISTKELPSLKAEYR